MKTQCAALVAALAARLALAAGLAAGLAFPAAAQMTSAAEVKPIYDVTRPNWVALRDYDGQDLFYVTQILSWRCGLEGFTYAINGGAPQPWDMEPCHEGTPAPNAMVSEAHLPYLRFEAGSVETVDIVLTFKDGTEMSESYQRASILMP